MKGCLKKEWLELVRTKKLLIYLAVAVGIVLMTIFLFFAMKMVDSIAGETEQLGGLLSMFDMTYSNSIFYYLSMMGTYFIIMVIIMTMRVVSKELEDKKWTLPICSGVKPSHMIASKLIVHTAVVIGTFIAASLLHLVLTVVFFSADISVGSMLFYYAMLLVFVVFMTVFTISLNAIIKKGWATCLISILTILFVSSIFGMIPIGDSTLSAFSPFLFFDLSQTANPMISQGIITYWYEYLCASISTVVVMALLVIFAIRSGKVAAQNLK